MLSQKLATADAAAKTPRVVSKSTRDSSRPLYRQTRRCCSPPIPRRVETGDLIRAKPKTRERFKVSQGTRVRKAVRRTAMRTDVADLPPGAKGNL